MTQFDVIVHVHSHADAEELRSIKSTLASLFTLGERTMSAITDFVAKQKIFNDRMDSAITGVTEDVQFLNDKIQQIQTSTGTLSPEDQQSLNEMQARTEAAVARLEALNALTPPTPPAVV